MKVVREGEKEEGKTKRNEREVKKKIKRTLEGCPGAIEPCKNR